VWDGAAAWPVRQPRSSRSSDVTKPPAATSRAAISVTVGIERGYCNQGFSRVDDARIRLQRQSCCPSQWQGQSASPAPACLGPRGGLGRAPRGTPGCKDACQRPARSRSGRKARLSGRPATVTTSGRPHAPRTAGRIGRRPRRAPVAPRRKGPASSRPWVLSAQAVFAGDRRAGPRLDLLEHIATVTVEANSRSPRFLALAGPTRPRRSSAVATARRWGRPEKIAIVVDEARHGVRWPAIRDGHVPRDVHESATDGGGGPDGEVRLPGTALRAPTPRDADIGQELVATQRRRHRSRGRSRCADEPLAPARRRVEAGVDRTITAGQLGCGSAWQMLPRDGSPVRVCGSRRGQRLRKNGTSARTARRALDEPLAKSARAPAHSSTTSRAARARELVESTHDGRGRAAREFISGTRLWPPESGNTAMLVLREEVGAVRERSGIAYSKAAPA